MLRTSSVVLALSLSLLGCRGGDDGGGDDQPGMPDAPGPIASDVTIQEIQNDAMPVDTQVSVKGVVVTAIDAFGSRTGDFFAQEPGGGEFSGIKIFGAPLETVATLQPGDLIDISNAVKIEFKLSTDMGNRTVTELKPVEGGQMVVTKVGTGTVPAPLVRDAVALQSMTREQREAEFEKVEGVLYTLQNVRQTRAITSFGSNPGPDSTEFRGTSFIRVQSGLVALPTTSVVGTCYTSITGIGDWFFNDLLLPRTQADLVGGGSGCLPMATTVAQLQTATTPPELVNLTGVYVTGRDTVGRDQGLWVADALQGAASNGVYVYTGNTMPSSGTPADPPPADAVIGARVNIVGLPAEFDLGMPPVGDTLTQIVNPLITNIVAPTASLPLPATTASVATLSDITAVGEPWEGVLVRVGPVRVSVAENGFGQIEFTDNDGAEIIMDDEAALFGGAGEPASPVLAGCYTLTGIMHVQPNANLRTINPRGPADIVTVAGGGPSSCN